MGERPEQRKPVDHESTRVISHREVIVEGVPVQWWAVGQHPVLVTVRTSSFASLAEFTYGDAEEFAVKLARKLLTKRL